MMQDSETKTEVILEHLCNEDNVRPNEHDHVNAEENISRLKSRINGYTILFRLLRLSILFLVVFALVVGFSSLYVSHYLKKNPEARAEIVQTVSDSFGVPISVDEISLGWEWSGPRLNAKNLRFYPDSAYSRPVVNFNDVSVTLDFLGYLRTRVLNVSNVEISGSEILLQKQDDSWYLNDYPILNIEAIKNQVPEELTNTSNFKLPFGDFTLKRINIVILSDQMEELWRFNDISAQINNAQSQTKVIFTALNNNQYEGIEFSAQSEQNGSIIERDWQLLFSADNVKLKKIITDLKLLNNRLSNQKTASFIDPETVVFLSEGNLNTKIWGELKYGTLNALNGVVEFSDLVISQGTNNSNVIKNIENIHFSLALQKQLKENKLDLVIDRESSLSDIAKLEDNRLNRTDNQLETIFTINDLVFNSDLGLWPKSAIKYRAVEYLSSLDNSVSPQSIGENIDALEIDGLFNKDQILSQDIDTVNVINRGVAIHSDARGDSEHDFNYDHAYELQLDYLYLKDIAPLYAVLDTLFKDSDWSKNIINVDWSKLDGVIKNATIHLYEDTVLREFDLQSAKLEFDQLAWRSIATDSHFTSLSGSLDFQDSNGYLQINSKDLNFNINELFTESLFFDELKANIEVSKYRDGFKFEAENLEIINTDLEMRGPASIVLLDDQILSDTNLILDIKDVTSVKKYYPVKIMREGLVNWLDTGIVSGQIDETTIQLKGDLKQFPFRNSNGLFQIDFDVADLKIDYAEDWPALTIDEGHIQFLNEGLNIQVKSASSQEIKSIPLQAGFSDLNNQPLKINISNQIFNLPELNTWLRKTPLYARLGSYLDNLIIADEASVTLDLIIPPKDTDNTTVVGKIVLDGNDLFVPSINETFSQVSGEINFTENDISANDLKSTFRGQSISANVKQDLDSTIVSISGNADMQELLQSDFITGNSAFTAEILVPNAEGDNIGIESIDLKSNLLGSKINIPPPFAKDEDTILPLSVKLDLSNLADTPVNLIDFSGSLNTSLLQGKLRFDETITQENNQKDSELEIYSIAVIGEGKGEYLQLIDTSKSQVQVLGQFNRLDTDEWFSYLARDSSSNDRLGALELGLVDVIVDELNIIGETLDNASLQVVPNETQWDIKIQDQMLAGDIEVPRPWQYEKPIEINLQRMFFVDNERKDDKNISLSKNNPLDDVNIEDIPNINFSVEELRYGDIDFGRFSGQLIRDGKGSSLKNLLVTNPEFTIEGSSGWYKTEQGDQTLLAVQLKTNNLYRTLQRLDYAPAATAGLAEVDIELTWLGNPLDDPLETISGKLDFKMLNGSLQEVDPGAGRFLALLSIAQLPSRLSLDFRDVFGRGLKYDEMSGEFILSNGQAYTNNLLMRGPVADVGVIGRVGLATQDFDQAAVVRADFGSSLPIAGALAGGLGVGAAVLLFSEIFKKPIKDATQIFYQIEGDWDDPNIKRVNPNQLKEIPIAP